MPKPISTPPKRLNQRAKLVRAVLNDPAPQAASEPQIGAQASHTAQKLVGRRASASKPKPPPHLERQPQTLSTGSHFAGIAPSAAYLYVDAATIHCKAILSERQKQKLKADCGHLDIVRHGEWRWDWRRQRFRQINIYPYAESYDAAQPGAYFLKFFGKRDDVRLTYAEIASDLTFDDDESRFRIFQFFERHLIQPRQQKFRAIEIFDNPPDEDGISGSGISTSSKRKGGHFFSGYNSRKCRIDDQTECWHFEGRYKGRASLARIGISAPRDLLNFNHDRHWQNFEDRGHLIGIDLERLGRHYGNTHAKTRRQRSDATAYGSWRSADHAIGAWVFRHYGRDEFGNISIEQFLRNYGRRGPYVTRIPYLSAFGIIGEGSHQF